MNDFWIGTYTGDRGAGQGIYGARRSGNGTLHLTGLAAPQESPSYLATGRRGSRLYAVGEGRSSHVRCYATDASGLRLLAQASVPGGACHVAVAPDDRQLVVSSYTAGCVSFVPLDEHGSTGGPQAVAQASGSGPRKDRQESPHPHAALLLTSGLVLSTDLGADKVRIHRRHESSFGLVGEVDMPAGSGPRHLIQHPNGLVYVLSELDHTIVVLRPTEAGGPAFDTAAVFPASRLPVEAASLSAAIKMSPDGRHLYTSIRGADIITTHRVAQEDGRLSVVDDVACGGDWPRDLWTDGTWMYVTNERSHSVTAFRLSRTSGVPELVGQTDVPSPVCIVAST
ncbi:lactonase family protein [Streptomyces sp. NPDC058576]|uniref:lactonase family protein n=1 Tax=Streptomyces sp. NPDC058576 TaxID=3346547 RepID=UPI00364E72D7